jgi:integrase
MDAAFTNSLFSLALHGYPSAPSSEPLRTHALTFADLSFAYVVSRGFSFFRNPSCVLLSCYLRATLPNPEARKCTRVARQGGFVPSIIPVKGGYRATVTRSKLGFRQSKTFTRKGDAQRWGTQLEADIDRDGLPEPEPDSGSIADLISNYIDRHQAVRELGRTKLAGLKQMLRWDITKLNPGELTQAVALGHLEGRRADGAGPATVNNDLVWLRTVLRFHGISKYRTAIDAINDASVVAKQMGITAKAKKRDRRPTDDELIQLTNFLRVSRNKWMVDVVWFAIYSARRQAEIGRLLREDNNSDELTGVVRNLKDPLKREIHERFKYTSLAWELIQRQPEHSSGRIFPRNEDSISKHFTTACKLLGIVDLRFHDLRHEAVSRLFEQGMDIPTVAQHSLHKQWATLQRYANLNPANAGKKIEHLTLDEI